ncbi:hypothetical protein QFW77_01930 [Luteimonas sp. RD2P54]|uniref:DUF4292 domain-containing protein n=1 Tax=Luteimonas endophytica TaxID=3042023 RepID=A0ABT6J4L4_9GAMM|nr:hypothetical protein [Luteimonas endophytica]MDH5821755.1 hypothetical protein [Luteimonas endophytica]
MSARPSAAAFALSALLLAACGAQPAAEAAATAAGTAAPAPEPTFADKVAGMAAAANPLSDPRAEVMAALDRMLAAKSYAAQIETGAGAMTLEHVAPDRFRMTLPDGITQTIVGGRMYMQMQGQTMELPLQEGMLEEIRDRGRIAAQQEGMRFESLGPDSVDGAPARKYRMTHEDPANPPATLWIGGDGYPLQMQVAGDAAQGTTTIRYSRFDDPSIRIEAPQ